MDAKGQVMIAGAGLVGLTLAIDLIKQGVNVVLIDKGDGVAEGSRSICQAKRTLEIWDRLGIGEAIRDRGVTWKVGRVFRGAHELFAFDLLPEEGHKMPAFVNLQRDIVEQLLRLRLAEIGGRVLNGHELLDAAPDAEGVTVTVGAPDGRRDVRCDWLVSCEGVRSNTRRALGLEFSGQVFRDRFLICDVKIDEDRPAERRFWFEPPFHDGQTALMHLQADGVCRIDLQLGWDADAEAEARPDSARRRIARVLGHDRFSFEWISAYVFQCRTLDRFVHGRIIFAGDSAHQVSPFGARGGNGGVQDADNLGWKLARVVKGFSPVSLLDSYDLERRAAALENIGHSTRATDFMTPKSKASRVLRDAVLDLAREAPFARAMVNSGRLSTAAHYEDSPLNTADQEAWADHAPRPGSPVLDAPVFAHGRPGFFTEQLTAGFTVVTDGEATWSGHDAETVAVLRLGRELDDAGGLLRARYDLGAGSTLLFRPDQHLAMRARTFDPNRIGAAVRRCLMLERENQVA